MHWSRHSMILALVAAFSAHAQNAPAVTPNIPSAKCRFPTGNPADPCMDRFVTPELDAVTLAMSTKWEGIQASLGSAYAGSWIDYDAQDKAYQVVALTRPMPIDDDYASRTRLQTVYVTFSDAELQAVANDIAQRYMTPVTKPEELRIISVGVDIKSNCVKVRALKKELVNTGNQLTQAGYNMNMICLREGHPVTLQ